MLTIIQCREYLDATDLSDKELEDLRDDLQSLIVGILDDEFINYDTF